MKKARLSVFDPPAPSMDPFMFSRLVTKRRLLFIEKQLASLSSHPPAATIDASASVSLPPFLINGGGSQDYLAAVLDGGHPAVKQELLDHAAGVQPLGKGKDVLLSSGQVGTGMSVEAIANARLLAAALKTESNNTTGVGSEPDVGEQAATTAAAAAAAATALLVKAERQRLRVERSAVHAAARAEREAARCAHAAAAAVAQREAAEQRIELLGIKRKEEAELVREREQQDRQLEDVQRRLDALNAVKHELVLQLKQVLQSEEPSKRQASGLPSPTATNTNAAAPPALFPRNAGPPPPRVAGAVPPSPSPRSSVPPPSCDTLGRSSSAPVPDHMTPQASSLSFGGGGGGPQRGGSFHTRVSSGGPEGMVLDVPPGYLGGGSGTPSTASSPRATAGGVPRGPAPSPVAFGLRMGGGGGGGAMGEVESSGRTGPSPGGLATTSERDRHDSRYGGEPGRPDMWCMPPPPPPPGAPSTRTPQGTPQPQRASSPLRPTAGGGAARGEELELVEEGECAPSPPRPPGMAPPPSARTGGPAGPPPGGRPLPPFPLSALGGPPLSSAGFVGPGAGGAGPIGAGAGLSAGGGSGLAPGSWLPPHMIGGGSGAAAASGGTGLGGGGGGMMGGGAVRPMGMSGMVRPMWQPPPPPGPCPLPPSLSQLPPHLKPSGVAGDGGGGMGRSRLPPPPLPPMGPGRGGNGGGGGWMAPAMPGNQVPLPAAVQQQQQQQQQPPPQHPLRQSNSWIG